MLRRRLNTRIGRTGLAAGFVIKLWLAAAAGAAVAWIMKLSLPEMHPALAALFVLGPYGLVFLAATFALRIPEASTALGRLRRG